MAWVRTTRDNHPYFKELADEYRISLAKKERLYTPEGKRWPIYFLSIHESSAYGEGIRVSVSKKEGKSEWVNEVNLPIDLIPELIEMLEEETE